MSNTLNQNWVQIHVKLTLIYFTNIKSKTSFNSKISIQKFQIKNFKEIILKIKILKTQNLEIKILEIQRTKPLIGFYLVMTLIIIIVNHD